MDVVRESHGYSVRLGNHRNIKTTKPAYSFFLRGLGVNVHIWRSPSLPKGCKKKSVMLQWGIVVV